MCFSTWGLKMKKPTSDLTEGGPRAFSTSRALQWFHGLATETKEANRMNNGKQTSDKRAIVSGTNPGGEFILKIERLNMKQAWQLTGPQCEIFQQAEVLASTLSIPAFGISPKAK